MKSEDNRNFLFSVVLVFALGLVIVAYFCGGEMMKCSGNPILFFGLSIGFIIISATVVISVSVYAVNLCINHFCYSSEIVYNNSKLISYKEKKSYEAKIEDSELEKIVFTNSTQKLNKGAFWGYSKLKYIELPSELTEIPEYAFTGCISLKEVELPQELKEIQPYTFAFCESLENITLPTSITSIGKSAFEGCKKLSSLTLPESITTIEKGAFAGCYNLVLHFESEDIAKKIIENEKCILDDNMKISYPNSEKDMIVVKVKNLLHNNAENSEQ